MITFPENTVLYTCCHRIFQVETFFRVSSVLLVFDLDSFMYFFVGHVLLSEMNGY